MQIDAKRRMVSDMKKRFIGILMVIMLVSLLPTTAFAASQSFIYTDSITKISFTVPQGWKEKAHSKEYDVFIAEFVPDEEDGTCILYGWSDVWFELSDSDKKVLTRADLGNDNLSKELVAETSGLNKSEVSTVTYNGKTYYTYSTRNSTESYGATLKNTITYLTYLDNGYVYSFLYSISNNYSGYHYSDFEKIIKSINYPQTTKTFNATDTTTDLWAKYTPGNILLSLIFTIVINSLPIIIYRYAVKKEPLKPKKAKKVTIIYGIIAFFVMAFIGTLINGKWTASISIILWSYVNYRVLTSGTAKQIGAGNTYVAVKHEAEKEEEPKLFLIDDQDTGSVDENIQETGATESSENVASSTAQDELSTAEEADTTVKNNHVSVERLPEIRFCHKCGSKLLPGSRFCSQCGEKIPHQE